jgi:hypothetical protein
MRHREQRARGNEMKYTVRVATPEGDDEGHSTWSDQATAEDKAGWISNRYGIATSVTDHDTNDTVWSSRKEA